MITSNLIRISTLILAITTLQAAPPVKPKPSAPNQTELRVFTSPTVSQTFIKIVANNNYVLIPKGVILYLPKTHVSKVTINSEGAKSTSWKTFQSRNRNLIHTVPLTKTQTLGTKSTPRYEMPYQKLEDLKKLGRIIICTYKDTPVRVKVQPKPEK